MQVGRRFGVHKTPEFPGGLDWINTGGREVRLAELRGRIVMLDFWTYGCINCRHVQPRLKELETRFADVLTVIGVHSGKFAHERITANLAAACDRQNVAHAVVNDRQYRIWRSFAVQAWPTVALIGAQGELLAVEPGEFPMELMVKTIRSAIADADSRDVLVRGPEPTAVAPRPSGETLRYPGRVLIEGDRLLVSDTGHGRVLDCEVVSEGEAPVVARVRRELTGFEEPQGLVLLGGSLWVADRAGQAVWRVESDDARERVLGTGTLADRTLTPGSGPSVDVRSPWGLAPLGDALVVAMAGAHQLWRLDTATLHASAWAGSGMEELTDGNLHGANLAQPTGVSHTVDGVAFADCESSAIRIATEEHGVKTIVGKGLFAFGDKSGEGGEVQMQHPEDVATRGDQLVVVDTYNDRLKLVDPRNRAARPWSGEAGEPGTLKEPAGVSCDGTRIAVADTGNHRVVLVGNDGSLREVRFE